MENQNKQNPEIKPDGKSKILFIIIGLLIAGSAAAAYYRYMIRRDYVIEAQIDCDPESENCFVWRCDPNSLEEGEACTGVPDNDVWYYKIIRRNAKNIPLCDPKDENCPAYVCGEGEEDCGYELCTPQDAEKGEECNDPQKYLEENPPEPEEEGEECAPDDEECQAASEETGTEECSPDDENCSAAADSDQSAQ